MVNFLKLETFQVDKIRELSGFVNVIGVQSLSYQICLKYVNFEPNNVSLCFRGKSERPYMEESFPLI